MTHIKSLLLATAGSIFIAAIFTAFSGGNIFVVFQALLVLFVAIFITLLIAIWERNRSNHVAPRIAYVIVMTGIFILLFWRTVIQLKHRNARKIVTSAQEYKQIHGYVPQNLNILGLSNAYGEFDYRASRDSQAFSLYYLIDGWHFKSYSSEDDKWTGGD